MFLLEVIPAIKIPLAQSQIFTYYTSLKLPRGSLILTSINKRLVECLVVESKEMKTEKMAIKRLGYELKSINKILFNGEMFSDNGIELIKWLADYYRLPLGLSLKTIIPKHPKKISRLKKTVSRHNAFDSLELSPDLQDIHKNIIQSPNNILIYNKTNKNILLLYVNLSVEALKNRKQVLFLEPELNSAKNLFAELKKYFKDDIALLDKNLSVGKYWELWQKIKNNDIKIIVGARSAIFAPLENLGLLIIKNEQDAGYKNWDRRPRYQVKDIALKIAEQTKAKIIYESPAPSVETYYQALNNRINLIEADKRPDSGVSIEITDMREEIKKQNFSVIGEKLRNEISEALKEKKKIILFMNRRGFATAVICRDCGMVIKCPHCDAPMAYHSLLEKKDALVCHYCDFIAPIPLLCPKCKSHRIKYMGTGTQKVAETIFSLFPKAKIQRMDSDAAKQGEPILLSGQEIKNVDILIGTQMIINGNSKEKFSLVGVINADTMLHLPDFRAGEKTFQWLCRLKNMAEKMIIQTYNPENKIIQFVKNNNYAGFYKNEIEERRIFSYPPFSNLIKLSYADKNSFNAKKEAKIMVSRLLNLSKTNFKDKIEIIGPAPAYVYKIKNRFVWNIIIKIKNDSDNNIKNLLLKSMPSDWLIDVNPISLL